MHAKNIPWRHSLLCLSQTQILWVLLSRWSSLWKTSQGDFREHWSSEIVNMCQYVNMCIWMHCSVFVFRDVLSSSTWALMWQLSCWCPHGYAVPFRRMNLLKDCLTMQSSTEGLLWQSPECSKIKLCAVYTLVSKFDIRLKACTSVVVVVLKIFWDNAQKPHIATSYWVF